MREVYISVDVETSGPIPGEYSLLSIGACNADAPDQTFLCELKPLTLKADPKALEVSGLSLDRLQKAGLDPVSGMRAFGDWVVGVVGVDAKPVFVGLNAPFDWSFVNYYFHRFLGKNPFGFAALDIKALYMGMTACNWSETSSSNMAATLNPASKGDHNALHDAVFQAELFRLIRERAQQR